MRRHQWTRPKKKLLRPSCEQHQRSPRVLRRRSSSLNDDLNQPSSVARKNAKLRRKKKKVGRHPNPLVRSRAELLWGCLSSETRPLCAMCTRQMLDPRHRLLERTVWKNRMFGRRISPHSLTCGHARFSGAGTIDAPWRWNPVLGHRAYTDLLVSVACHRVKEGAPCLFCSECAQLLSHLDEDRPKCLAQTRSETLPDSHLIARSISGHGGYAVELNPVVLKYNTDTAYCLWLPLCVVKPA